MLTTLQHVARTALLLGEQDRATRHADGEKPESVTTHTVMLMMALIEVTDTWQDFDHSFALPMALVHDLPEALVGDTDTLGIAEADRAAKDRREVAAARTLVGQLPALSFDIDHYHLDDGPACLEAQVVGYLDKIMPKLTHMANQGAMLHQRGLDAAGVRALLDEQRLALRERYPLAAARLEPLFLEATEGVLAAFACGAR